MERDRSQSVPAPSEPVSTGHTILRVAWFSVLLGLTMEAVLLLLGGGLGDVLGLGSLVADLAQNISWSVFVCVGLAVGTTIANTRLPLMGLTGLLAAPTAFEVSRLVHRGVTEALGAPAQAATGSVLLIALLKGLEYACLAVAVGWLARRARAGLGAHAAAGFAVGVAFGGVIIAVGYAVAPSAPSDLVPQAINEVLFPVGCAVVLFTSGVLARKPSSRV